MDSEDEDGQEGDDDEGDVDSDDELLAGLDADPEVGRCVRNLSLLLVDVVWLLGWLGAVPSPWWRGMCIRSFVC